MRYRVVYTSTLTYIIGRNTLTLPYVTTLVFECSKVHTESARVHNMRFGESIQARITAIAEKTHGDHENFHATHCRRIQSHIA